MQKEAWGPWVPVTRTPGWAGSRDGPERALRLITGRGISRVLEALCRVAHRPCRRGSGPRSQGTRDEWQREPCSGDSRGPDTSVRRWEDGLGRANPRNVGACPGFLSPLCASPRGLECRWNRRGGGFGEGAGEWTRLCWCGSPACPAFQISLGLLPPVPWPLATTQRPYPGGCPCLCRRLLFPQSLACSPLCSWPSLRAWRAPRLQPAELLTPGSHPSAHLPLPVSPAGPSCPWLTCARLGPRSLVSASPPASPVLVPGTP